MSITNELREWAKNNTMQSEVLTTYPVQHPVHGTLESLIAIADHIDTEHEKAVVDALLNDGLPMTDKNMAEHGWIRLPLDANGVPIHIGDFIEEISFQEIGRAKGEVIRIVYNKHLNEVRIDTGTGYADRNPTKVRHMSKPLTVEDVLTEFVTKLIERNELTNGAAQTITEYAAKLRLAKENE